MSQIKYKRVLLKLSGESFCEPDSWGIESSPLKRTIALISELVNLGVEVALVNGAGNLMRGSELTASVGVQRTTGDHMGMLATVMNSLALGDALNVTGIETRVLTAAGVTSLCETFKANVAQQYLSQGKVIICTGGTGNPFFTTDTCAALRGCEVHAEVVIKATKVDGVYDSDPVKNPDAKLYRKLSFAKVFQDDLKVMDHAAISLCRDNEIDIIVCNMTLPGVVTKVVLGEKVGTLVSNQI